MSRNQCPQRVLAEASPHCHWISRPSPIHVASCPAPDLKLDKGEEQPTCGRQAPWASRGSLRRLDNDAEKDGRKDGLVSVVKGRDGAAMGNGSIGIGEAIRLRPVSQARSWGILFLACDSGFWGLRGWLAQKPLGIALSGRKPLRRPMEGSSGSKRRGVAEVGEVGDR